jgi:hypothetical protein
MKHGWGYQQERYGQSTHFIPRLTNRNSRTIELSSTRKSCQESSESGSFASVEEKMPNKCECRSRKLTCGWIMVQRAYTGA